MQVTQNNTYTIFEIGENRKKEKYENVLFFLFYFLITRKERIKFMID